MSDNLVIRPANDKDRLATLENTWRHWGGGLTRDEFFENRLNSPQFQRSRRFVGLIDDEVVVSLAAYTCRFQLQGDLLDGVAIGSVYTKEDHRGHGYASQLMSYVDRIHTTGGAKLSVLYSDISPQFYERLGYVTCPSWKGDVAIEPNRPAPAGGWQLQAFDPTSALFKLETLYREDYGSVPLYIERDLAYWKFTLDYRKDDQFYWFLDGEGQTQGYVRLALSKQQEMHIVDHAFSARSDKVELALYLAVKHLAAEQSAHSIHTWIPNSPVAQACFKVQPRQDEITMIKALDPRTVVSPAAIEAAQYFHEVDHV